MRVPLCLEVKLYVGNLSWGTEAGALRDLFEEYGKVVDCYLPVDKETGQHRGFAFVTMDPNDAQRAADETDGYELDGRILRVNEAQPKGASRSYNNYNDGYDGGDAYDGGAGDSWGNEAY
jgi:RNA recognition motif-containing protein